MAITIEEKWDKIEIVGEYKALQLRKKIIVKEDGDLLTNTNWRIALDCGTLDAEGNWSVTDLSSYPQEIQDVAAVVWTDAVKDAWKAHLESK